MQLPLPLQKAIQSLAEKEGSFKALQAAHAEMSDHYRQGKGSHRVFHRRAQLLSYLIARCPATFSVCVQVFTAIREQLPGFTCHSLLDLGAGPGTASWAALHVFEELQTVCLLEQEQIAVEMGQELGLKGENITWKQIDLERPFTVPPADLAVFSYSLGEMQNPMQVLERVWNQDVQCVALIEPGTPQGFEKIRQWRKEWIERGAEVIAPCPHRLPCPMQGGQWCHFAARVERSRLHRQLKGGTLGYEDEKFSYLVLGRPGRQKYACEGRVLCQPLVSKGQIRFTVCHAQGRLQEVQVTRRELPLFREAKKVEWGSIWRKEQEIL